MAFEGGEDDGEGTAVDALDGLPPGPRDPTDPGEALDGARERKLLHLDAATDGMERPYLPRIPDTPAAEYTVFEWLDFLTRKAGFKARSAPWSPVRSAGSARRPRTASASTTSGWTSGGPVARRGDWRSTTS